MAFLARSVVRLVVVLALAGALIAVAVGSIAYSTGRLFHDVATAKRDADAWPGNRSVAALGDICSQRHGNGHPEVVPLPPTGFVGPDLARS